MPKKNAEPRWLPLLLLTALLTACATSSPPSCPMLEPVPPPRIPALPSEARQPDRSLMCSPTCSEGWSRLVEEWQQKLKSTGAPASLPSAPTTP